MQQIWLRFLFFIVFPFNFKQLLIQLFPFSIQPDPPINSLAKYQILNNTIQYEIKLIISSNVLSLSQPLFTRQQCEPLSTPVSPMPLFTHLISKPSYPISCYLLLDGCLTNNSYNPLFQIPNSSVKLLNPKTL